MTTGLTSLYDKPSRSFFDSVSSSRGQRVARSEWGTPSDTWVKIIVMVVMVVVVVVMVVVVVVVMVVVVTPRMCSAMPHSRSRL